MQNGTSETRWFSTAVLQSEKGVNVHFLPLGTQQPRTTSRNHPEASPNLGAPPAPPSMPHARCSRRPHTLVRA